MTIDLRQLRAMSAISKYGGFSSAAREINVTQPTLSTHIRNLENYLGVRLFDRSGRQVTLTPAGRVFADYAQRIIDMCDQSVEAVRAFMGEIKGKVVLEASTVPGVYLLPRWMGSFTRTYPDVRITLTVSDSSTVKEKVRSGEIPVGVIGSATQHPLSSQLLCKDEIILVAPAEITEGLTGSEQTLSDLAALPLIRREAGSGTQENVETALREKGIDPDSLNWKATLGSTQAVIEGVAAGLGAGFLSEVTVRRDIESGEMARLEIEGLKIERNFYIVTHSGRSISPAAQRLMEFLQSAAQS